MIDGHLMISVPSRLHARPTPSQPLAGLRLCIKDIFNLSGVKTTGQCQSYERLYLACNTTAPSIQKLSPYSCRKQNAHSLRQANNQPLIGSNTYVRGNPSGMDICGLVEAAQARVRLLRLTNG